jgi:HEAT repeat protein
MRNYILAGTLILAVAGGTARGQDDPVTLFRSLDKKLYDPDPKVRLEATKALEKIGAQLRSVTSTLTRKLEDPDPGVRLAAARALQDIVMPNYSPIRSLTKALQDKDVALRREAATLLGRMGPLRRPFAKTAVPALTKALKDNDTEVRLRAASSLGLIGPEARSAVPALAEMGLEPDKGVPPQEDVRMAAIIALGNLGPAASEAAPALRKMMQSADLRCRTQALRSLAMVAPPDKALLDLLTGFLKDKHLPMRLTAAERLGELGPDAKDAVPDLLAALKAKDVGDVEDTRKFRQWVIVALGNIGPAAKEAVAVLREFVTGDAYLCVDAEKAIKSIQGGE